MPITHLGKEMKSIDIVVYNIKKALLDGLEHGLTVEESLKVLNLPETLLKK